MEESSISRVQVLPPASKLGLALDELLCSWKEKEHNHIYI